MRTQDKKDDQAMSTTTQHNHTNDTIIRGYTLKELAALYGVSTKCLRTWLEPHAAAVGEKKGRYFTTLQVRIIFKKLGEPG